MLHGHLALRSPFSSEITVFYAEEKFKCSNKRGDPTDISLSKTWHADIMKTWGSLIMKNVLSWANGSKMFSEGLHWSKKPQERHSDRLNIGNSFVCPDNLWCVMYFHGTTGCKGIIFQKTYYPSGRTSVAFIKHYGSDFETPMYPQSPLVPYPPRDAQWTKSPRLPEGEWKCWLCPGGELNISERFCDTKLNWLVGEFLHKVEQWNWPRWAWARVLKMHWIHAPWRHQTLFVYWKSWFILFNLPTGIAI